jgi:hypothetical protein
VLPIPAAGNLAASCRASTKSSAYCRSAKRRIDNGVIIGIVPSVNLSAENGNTGSPQHDSAAG